MSENIAEVLQDGDMRAAAAALAPLTVYITCVDAADFLFVAAREQQLENVELIADATELMMQPRACEDVAGQAARDVMCRPYFDKTHRRSTTVTHPLTLRALDAAQ